MGGDTLTVESISARPGGHGVQVGADVTQDVTSASHVLEDVSSMAEDTPGKATPVKSAASPEGNSSCARRHC